MCTRISRQFIIPLPLTFWRIHADTPGEGREDWRCTRVRSGGEKVERGESGGGIIREGRNRTWKSNRINTREERKERGTELYNYAI